MAVNFDNTYARLPAQFYAQVNPSEVAAPRVIKYNAALAADLGIALDPHDEQRLAQIFSGNALLPGSQPIAMAYAGHQFGQFVPQLGDGRAILLGEVRDGRGQRRDVQLKGAGRTPYSRGGDGRAALGPVLREYLVSESMAALGIATTRSLCAVASGQTVRRETALPGAILTRVALSHIRVGTFQFFATRGDVESLRLLADHVIERHYSELSGTSARYARLLERVSERQASLIASWMQVGFIHGVMNTDNTSVAGETIDYGPCAFMDAYDPNTVFSSIDVRGRYAYGNQPAIAQWNLARFAETLLPLIDSDENRAIELATEAIGKFSPAFDALWLQGMRSKIGLNSSHSADGELIGDLLSIMQHVGADFTNTFRELCAVAEHGIVKDAPLAVAPQFRAWIERWQHRCEEEMRSKRERAEAMRAVNPKYIPRNHRIEQLIVAAVEHEDYALFERFLAILAQPFDEHVGEEHYAQPPREDERVLNTFCGT